MQRLKILFGSKSQIFGLETKIIRRSITSLNQSYASHTNRNHYSNIERSFYFKGNRVIQEQQQYQQSSDENARKMKDKGNKKANLGSMIQMLQHKVPDLLTESLPAEYISKDVILRILPKSYPNIPEFKGSMVYHTTIKTIQLFLTSFYLNPGVKLHITNIKVMEPSNSLSTNELIELSINNNSIESSTKYGQELSQYTTKIIIKWRTCLKGCPHLNNLNTTSATSGTFNTAGFEIAKYFHLTSPLKFKNDENHDPMIRDEHGIERIVTGIFIFELNAENDQIVVHTVDNCEVLENKETVQGHGGGSENDRMDLAPGGA
ncbi:hypothetical protein CANARDRAFT_26103 [[Candida] arabinofermentans NRRL YB-2248]|uniref:Uncharacterized protein n=1 Tax=[Candida] arabinofermentans NRRL YB-2248 TaxID=983967 RepID=A0A1E4T852_9ASCO|nr:hypothetical protein CANARDRAFT_26103 [[Candida] arabinofermentans NRRL YB-2248]